jgi:hypothetical protein
MKIVFVFSGRIMPPKKRNLPSTRSERDVEPCSRNEESIVSANHVGDDSKDIGSSKKQRALEATDIFAKYTDRIKELEVNHTTIIYCVAIKI